MRHIIQSTNFGVDTIHIPEWITEIFHIMSVTNLEEKLGVLRTIALPLGSGAENARLVTLLVKGLKQGLNFFLLRRRGRHFLGGYEQLDDLF